MYTEQELHAFLARDFGAFLEKAFEAVSPGDRFKDNWHLEAITWQLEKIERGQTRRLIVTMPPRHLKSITISVAWVAWMLGRDPTRRFVCASYAAELALKHARDCRSIMQTDWYRRTFPRTRIDKVSEHDFTTTQRGGRLSTSVGGVMTGRGGSIIVIDDPLKPDEAASLVARNNVKEWYQRTVASRLDDKNEGTVVLVMQRLHEDDLAGYLLEAGSWEHLNLPAIAEADGEIELWEGQSYQRKLGDVLQPERESLAVLEATKREMGSANFSAQYQQAPVPSEGTLVKREWLRRWTVPPARQQGDRIVQSWDTASKDGVFNDWSVCITALVRRREIYVLDLFRRKLEFPDLMREVISRARRDEITALLIEDAASGQQLIQMLNRDQPAGVPRPIRRPVEKDKVTRMSAQSSRIEAGELLLPTEASWLAEFERELIGFPSTRHDDQVDALVQLLEWTGQRPREPDVIFGGMVIEYD